MLREVDVKEAVRRWLKGKKVIALMEDNHGAYDAYPLGDVFETLRFLAEFPAGENPEFEAAVDQMVADRKPDEPKAPPEPTTEPELKEPEPQPEPSPPKKPAPGKKKERPEKAEALRLIAEGMKPGEVCRKLGIAETTLYYWRYPEKFEKKKKSAKTKESPKPETEPPG